MTQKQEEALNTVISALPDNCRKIHREVAEYAVSLGYIPSLKGMSVVTLNDGKQGFLCGFGLLPLPSFNAESVTEVKEALRVQDASFIKQISQ